MSRADKIALLLSLLAIAAAWLVADRVFERVPHLEDEIAYVWQARLMAAGELTTATPIEPKRFLVPFVVDYEGRRFGKYPLGWPALLSVGVRLGLRDWVNPLLAGLAVWLTYRLGKKILGEITGLVAAALTLTSPFFLMNTGSLLSHPLGLVLTLGFVLAWWDATTSPGGTDSLPRGLSTLLAGLALGAFAVTRPFSAIGVAVPFGVHGIILLVRGPAVLRRRVLAIGLLAAAVGALHYLWQFAATGDAFLNPYTLWWPYDQVGFGPGAGRAANGHTLRQAFINTNLSLYVGRHDLFGWLGWSWIFLPCGLWAIRRNGRAWLTSAVYPSLLVLYLAYWIGSWTFGPRYQFEGLFSLTLLSAAGISWLAGWPRTPGDHAVPVKGIRMARPLGVTAVVGLLVGLSLVFYVPRRLGGMSQLYGISRSQLAPFEDAGHLAPAVLIVHAGRWTEYGGLLELENPLLTSPFLFVFGGKGGLEETLREAFPGRAVYHYYPDEPDKFYVGARK